jgi:hypothetical protein
MFETSQQYNHTIDVHENTTIYGRDHVIMNVGILPIPKKYRCFFSIQVLFVFDSMVSILISIRKYWYRMNSIESITNRQGKKGKFKCIS